MLEDAQGLVDCQVMQTFTFCLANRLYSGCSTVGPIKSSRWATSYACENLKQDFNGNVCRCKEERRHSMSPWSFQQIMLTYLRDLLRGPLRGAPVESMPIVNEPVECSHGLLYGRVDIWSVCEH
jgi:hypothetical protein